MKKILSVVLAIMMLFSVMTVGASATSKYPDQWHREGLANDNQAVLVFNIMGGSMRDPQLVYNATTGGFDNVSGVTGTYVMLPFNDEANIVGSVIVLPIVTPQSGMAFLGWEYTDPSGLRHTLAGGSTFYITEAHFTGNQYGVINFTAVYTSAEPEEDTMATVLSILTKIFGAIIGIVLYGGDTEAGVALMNKVLGGLL